MNEFKFQESQPELFPEHSGAIKKPERAGAIKAPQNPVHFTLFPEQIILAAILLILAACFIFFLGVLRGKVIKNQAPVAASAPAPSIDRGASVAAQTTRPVAAPQQTRLVLREPNVLSSAVTKDPAKAYTLQLVSYKKRDLAEKKAQELRQKGFYSEVLSGSGHYAVCVGEYRTKGEAQADLQRLAPLYKGCYLRRRN